MSLRPLLASILLALSLPVFAAGQEETFTEPEAGADYVDPKKLSQLADRNDPKALNNIGWLWARGQGGVKQDFKEAMLWWKQAARHGYTPAMNNVGLLYAQGNGVKQNYEEAFKWWMRAAERGDAWAMNAVGDLYENGQGVERNYELALSWYKEAAREGDPMGLWNVGNLTEQGLGTTADPAAALDWYRQAAEKGYAPAMHSLGALYARGRGTTADPVEAFALLSLAAQRFGPEDAAEAAAMVTEQEALASRLDAAQRAAAEARTQELDRLYRAPSRSPKGNGSEV